MLQELKLLKGIHPGFVLERKIAERHMNKGQLALAVREYPQTLSSITKGRRGIPAGLALKLERALGLEEGYFTLLQAYYDIREAKQKEKRQPDTRLFRPALFWDTDPSSLDWNRQAKAIILRVMDRGTAAEKRALADYYGHEKIEEILKRRSKKK
jgi:antitoxin HigA-1